MAMYDCNSAVVALEAFRDVVRDGQRRSLKLISERTAQRDIGPLEQIQHRVVKPPGLLPDRQILEALVFGHVDFPFSAGILVGVRSPSRNGRWQSPTPAAKKISRLTPSDTPPRGA
jgi:hypothetical protein